MTDSNGRRIPPPPPRRTDPDDELTGAYDDLGAEPEPPPKQRRRDFIEARKTLVDLYTAASGGRLDHTAFNGLEVDEIAGFAAANGVRGWVDLAAENQQLRAALGDELVSRHRHLSADDLSDVLDPSRPFNLDDVLGRAGDIETERSESARGLLIAALSELGIDTSGEDFDVAAVLQAAANPAPATPQPPTEYDPLNSPSYRTANLPTGRPFNASRLTDDIETDGLTGSALIEALAAADIASGRLGL